MYFDVMSDVSILRHAFKTSEKKGSGFISHCHLVMSHIADIGICFDCFWDF